MGPTVQLTYQDLIVSTTQASLHTSKALKANRVEHDHGKGSSRSVAQRLGDKVIGELGELALAKHFDLPKSSSAKPFESGDVADGYEVRATEHDGGHLLIYDSDPDLRYFLAVVSFSQNITVELPGWAWAREVRKDRFLRDSDPPCYWIPQSELNPINPHN